MSQPPDDQDQGQDPADEAMARLVDALEGLSPQARRVIGTGLPVPRVQWQQAPSPADIRNPTAIAVSAYLIQLAPELSDAAQEITAGRVTESEIQDLIDCLVQYVIMLSRYKRDRWPGSVVDADQPEGPET
jgi:hypothetical protein